VSPRHEYHLHVEKIVRSRELALINGPLRVKEDGGNRRRHGYRLHVEKIVRSRELALINGPLRVKEDGGNRRHHATSIVYTLKKLFAVGS